MTCGIYQVQAQNFKYNSNTRSSEGLWEFRSVTEKSTGRCCISKETKLNINEKYFKQEIKVLSSCHHPAINEFIGFAVEGRKGYIYLKEAEKGSLERCIRSNHTELQNNSYKEGFTPLWNDTQKLIIAYGVASAMEYLHSKNICNQNLNPENILIDNELFPYITNFGSPLIITDDIKLSPTIKTSSYKIIPPEFLQDYEKYNRSLPIDTFSYALVLYRLWTELQVFPKLSEVKILQSIIKSKRPEFPKGNYPGENWKKLINECWSQEPERRPTFSEICDLLESSEFLTPNIDVNLFEKYKKRCKIDHKNSDSEEKQPFLIEALKSGSIPALLSYGNLCEKDSKFGCPDIFYEIAANCCHCLDKEKTKSLFFLEDFKAFVCEDCNMEICEGCAKKCHKDHNIIEKGTKNLFVCDCGKNHFTDKKERKHCSMEFVGKMLFGDKPVCYQHFYRCRDCQPIINTDDDNDYECEEQKIKYICQGCSEQCHKGHNLEDCGVKAGYCSCGAHEFGRTCKCKSVYYFDNKPGDCTCSKFNFPVLQRWFQCVTCCMINSNDQGICKTCAEECHKDHILIDRGVRRFKCQCQTSGSCKLLK